VWRTAFPVIKEESETEMRAIENKPDRGRIVSLTKNKHLMSGVVAEFFYVGGQACVTSFFIRYSEHVAGFGEHHAAKLLSIALLLFMLGRLSGTALMTVINPVKLLVTYAIINIGLIAAAVTLHGFGCCLYIDGGMVLHVYHVPNYILVNYKRSGAANKAGFIIGYHGYCRWRGIAANNGQDL
jgi:FHS family L-fucose permease-like MFS transporter